MQGPWPAILERLPEYEPDTLLLSLEFYRESVLRRVVDDHGHVKVSLVDVAEVARGLSAGVSLASGILPGDEAGPNTLFWARSSGSTRLGIWVGPRIWRLTLRSFEPGGKDRRLRLAFPGLLFVCRPDASGAYVFAAAKRPRNPEDVLAPLPGSECVCERQDLPRRPRFRARSTEAAGGVLPVEVPPDWRHPRGKSSKYPDDISRLWDELAGQDTFPCKDLVPMLTVQQACDLAL